MTYKCLQCIKNGYCTIENAMITPPKFNIAPEKGWQRKMSLTFGARPIFRVYIKLGGGGILSHITMPKKNMLPAEPHLMDPKRQRENNTQRESEQTWEILKMMSL